MKPKFEAGQTYTTRDGRKAKVYEVYADRIHGAVLLSNNHWSLTAWHADGRRVAGQNYPRDLMLPKLEPREWYLVWLRCTKEVVVSTDLMGWEDYDEDEIEIVKVREVIEEK